MTVSPLPRRRLRAHSVRLPTRTDRFRHSMAESYARDLARQILARDLAPTDTATPVSVAAAAERAFHRLANGLAQWVGADGCQALFTRALALAQAQDRALKAVPPPARSALFLDALAANAEPHDGASVLD